MNILLLKQVALFSALIGAAIGIITLIPFIGTISFLVLILLLSAIIIVYLKKNDLIGIIDMREGAILGAVIGFSSFMAFAAVYTPISIIIGLIFRQYYIGHLFTIFLTNFGGFFIMLLLLLFVGLISALMNAFSGLTTAYIYEMLSGLKKAENENIDFEIK
ncbi:MAG: hypothetical protein ACI4S3_10140 [Candidatus Gastranaerophilaceae bacterium]